MEVCSALLSFPPPPPGGLSSTTSGAHGGGRSVESRDGSEELSTPAVKRKCVREENSTSLVTDIDGDSVHGE